MNAKALCILLGLFLGAGLGLGFVGGFFAGQSAALPAWPLTMGDRYLSLRCLGGSLPTYSFDQENTVLRCPTLTLPPK